MNINATLKGLVIFGVFAILFTPFIVAQQQFFPFITGKGFVFRIVVEVIFAIWIFLLIRDRSIAPKFSWITGFALIFLGIITLADLFGENSYKSIWSNFERMEGLVSLVHLTMYFLVVSSVLNSERLWRAFLNTSVVSSVIMVFFSFFQLGGLLAINQGGVRVDGTFGNATYLAVFMLINMFFSVLLFAKSSSIYLRLAYAAAFILQGVVLYYTATRGAILGIIGGLAFSALLITFFARGQRRARIAAVSVLLLIIIMVGGFFTIRDTDFVKNSLTLNRFATLETEGIKSQGRYYVWPMAWEGFLERPILGWGQENFSYVFNKNYDPRMFRHEQWFDRVHNVFLDWLIAGGILGFISYWFLYAALFFYVWRGKNEFTFIEKAVLTGLVSAYIVHNVFVFDHLISYILFFSLLAYVHSRSTAERNPIGWISRMTSNPDKIQKIALPIIILLVIPALYFVNMKPILANRTLLRAIDFNTTTPQGSLDNLKKVFAYNTLGSTEAREQLLIATTKFLDESVPMEVRADFVKLAKEQIEIQVEKTPKDTRILQFAGNFYNQIGDNKVALGYFERALETSPRKQAIMFGVGAAHIGLGQSEYPKALEVFKKAYELVPEYPEARFVYGLGAVYNRNVKLTNELFAPLNQELVLFDDRLLLALINIGEFNQVLELLQKRVELRPESADLRIRVAAAYFQVGNRFRAIQELRRAVELDPKTKGFVEHLITEIEAGRNPLE